MRNGQQVAIFAFGMLLIGGVVVETRLAAPPPTNIAGGVPFAERLPPGVTLRLRGVRVTGRAKGVPSWRLHAGVVDSTRDANQVSFRDGIEADFLENGQKRATVTAPQAVYQVMTKRVMASGGIVCSVQGQKPDASKDLRITTPEVTWNIGSRTITCPRKVEVTRPEATVRGINLSVDLISREYSLHKMEGEFELSDDSDPEQVFDVLPQSQH